MPTIPAIRHQYRALPDDVQSHLGKLPDLLEGRDLDLILAYLFMMIEQGRYRSIKCVLIRTFKCKTSVVDDLLADRAFSRSSFRSCIKSIAGIDVSSGEMKVLSNAEEVRDTIMHGRKASDDRKRQAIFDCLTFIHHFGEKIRKKTTKNPFATLQGLAGNAKPLSEPQSRWIVRGILEVNKVDKIQTVPEQ